MRDVAGDAGRELAQDSRHVVSSNLLSQRQHFWRNAKWHRRFSTSPARSPSSPARARASASRSPCISRCRAPRSWCRRARRRPARRRRRRSARPAARPSVIPCNISDKAQVRERLIAETQKQLGPVDVLVCNAASNPVLRAEREAAGRRLHEGDAQQHPLQHVAGQSLPARHAGEEGRLDHDRVVDRRRARLGGDRRLLHLQGGRHAARAQPRARVRARQHPREHHRARPGAAPTSPRRCGTIRSISTSAWRPRRCAASASPTTSAASPSCWPARPAPSSPARPSSPMRA